MCRYLAFRFTFNWTKSLAIGAITSILASRQRVRLAVNPGSQCSNPPQSRFGCANESTAYGHRNGLLNPEIGALNVIALGEFRARTAQRNPPVLQHIGVVAEPERKVGILLDQHDRQSLLPVDCLDQAADLL